MNVFTLIAFVSSCFLIFLKASTAIDSISPSEPLPDGKTLISNDGSFELGFFRPGSSRNRYLGIWYKNIPVCTVVWVANRVNPTNDSSSVLMVTTTGDVQLRSQNRTVVWSANSTKAAQNPVLRLLNSGNLVLIDGRDGHTEAYLWQSFDYPSDTLLPGMKLGWDLRTGVNRRLSAWKNSDDPSPGDFTWEIELQANPEWVLWKGSEKYYRSGPWNGIRFSGGRLGPDNPVYINEFVSNEEEVYYMFSAKNKSLPSRIVLNQTDYTKQRYIWSEETRTWKLWTYVPSNYFEKYGVCGAYGNGDSTQLPACQCLKGFKPKSPNQWSAGDWSQGCVRNKPLNCQAGDGFIQFGRLKLPDATHSWVNKTMSLKECRDKCFQNCSCMAYTSLDIRGRGSGCAIWFGNLVDIRQSQSGGQDLFIRMSASEVGMNIPFIHLSS